MPLSGAAIAYAVTGGLILYSGVKNATIANTIRGTLTGNLGNVKVNPPPASSTGTTGASGSTATTTDVSATASQETWIKDLLSALGAPASQANIASITDWMAHEEPSSDWAHWNNPMNTTLTLPGSVSQNSVGVKSYPSLQDGLEATVETLTGGGYGDILMLLRSGQGLKSGAEQGLMRWSGGGYSSV